jgi:membrane protease subunit (stomatin/prohibitin family)
MDIQVADSRKFLIKLVGTERELTAEHMRGYFREAVAARVKSYLTRIMSEVSFVVVNQRLDDISAALRERLADDLDEFGIGLANFYVSTIHIPDEDKARVKDSLANVSARGIEGYNWVDEQMADIAKKYAANPGSAGNVAGMAAQMPMAFAFGQMLSGAAMPIAEKVFSGASMAFGNAQPQPGGGAGKTCPNCGAASPGDSVFCPKCGTALPREAAQGGFCRKCGHKLAEGDSFCPKCGTKA